jgi:glyoxylate reductase
MAKAKIYITRQIPGQGITLLKRKGYQIKISPHDRVLKKTELIRNIKGIDALYCLLTDKIDGQIMDAAGPQLKIIANYAVGFDNIDLDAAKERGIMVSNTPVPEVSESVAEHALALMMSLAHRIVEVDKYTRAGKYHGWSPSLLLGTDIIAKTIGIVGLGRIGHALVRRLAQGFKVKILYSDIRRDPAFERRYQAKRVTLPTLLKQADFISLHVPLLPSTRHLISFKQLNLMKKTAFLINTSRGPVVDELALVKALIKRQIAGAALDVFECEPLIDCNPRDTYELRKLSNVILTPHTASATIESRQAMSVAGAKNIIAALSGKKPPNLVKAK